MKRMPSQLFLCFLWFKDSCNIFPRNGVYIQVLKMSSYYDKGYGYFHQHRYFHYFSSYFASASFPTFLQNHFLLSFLFFFLLFSGEKASGKNICQISIKHFSPERKHIQITLRKVAQHDTLAVNGRPFFGGKFGLFPWC